MVSVPSEESGHMQVSDLPDVVIASSALNPLHPDLQLARKHSVPVLSRRQWFRQSLHNFCQIAASGTHGKTTTASMIAYAVHAMGVRVPFLVGGDIPQLPLTSFRTAGLNTGNMLVVEADEYGEAFLGLSPMVSVLTNVGWDHVDQFKCDSRFHVHHTLWPPILLHGR
jgi:UDP-N-acetylmuramate--alanine ligase